MTDLKTMQSGVVLRTVAGCSILSSCLVATGATTYDLTAGGAVQFPAPAYVVDFTTDNPAPDAVGSFSSMYRLGGEGIGVQAGYNASRWNDVPVMPDVDRSPAATTDVTFGELGAQILNGQLTSVLSLVLNETELTPPWIGPGTPGALRPIDDQDSSRISLDAFQVYLANSPLQNASDLASLQSHAELVFDLDYDFARGVAEDRSLLLNARNSDNAAGDVFVNIPVELFHQAGATETSYVYVYSEFGGLSGFEANPGHEEWAFLKSGSGVPRAMFTPSHVPEASTWMAGIAMAGLLGGTFWMRRTRA